MEKAEKEGRLKIKPYARPYFGYSNAIFEPRKRSASKTYTAGGRDCQTYPIYQDFCFPDALLDQDVFQILTRTLDFVCGIVNGGRKFERALLQKKQFVQNAEIDPTGLKRVFFDSLDSFSKGSTSFSYHVWADDAKEYLNLNYQR